jgi:iron complex outermembrane receptor protein
VPQVVNAVTADTLQKLNIRNFQDIASVVPGLSLQTNNTGSTSAASMRGITFNAVTNAQASVAFYLNDASVQSVILFTSLFDVGQVEVLRGPQGTTRGVPAPSGAITVTTRRPDLSQFGGYVDVTATDLGGRNVNGAINIPIIRDVLGVRVAGVMEQNTVDGVRSFYSRLKPEAKNSAIRTSVSFEPSDLFNADVVWTHIDTTKHSFVPVTGLGDPGRTPLIAEKDRLAAADLPNILIQHFDTVQLKMESRIFGQRLAYVGSGTHLKYTVTEDRDQGQNLVGVPFGLHTDTSQEATTQELRLMSDPAPDRLFDYVVGAYYDWARTSGGQTSPASFLPGAFGPTNNISIANFDPQFQLPQLVVTPIFLQTTSIFGSVNLHLGRNTEFTAGARHIWAQAKTGLAVSIGAGATLVNSPVCGGPLRPGTFPGTCIANVPGRGVVAAPTKTRDHDEYTIYNLQLKHRFGDDLMVYGSVGTAFRPPFSSIGSFANADNDPTLNSFLVHPSETSRTFEVGAKWTFLEGRGRLNAAVFRQKLKFTPYQTAAAPYLSVNGVTPPAVLSTVFVASPDGLVEGFDLDAAFQITPQWSISGQLAYADGRVTGGSNSGIPCNDSNFDGQPDTGTPTVADFRAAGVHVALCSGQPLTQEPYWNATLQSEYVQPINDDMDVYLRGLFSYYPKNTRRTAALTIDNYSLLNLYTGVRAHDGAWEAGLFVKNALKTDKLLDRKTTPINTALNAFNAALPTVSPIRAVSSNYFEKLLAPRREVGINIRYAFGSR